MITPKVSSELPVDENLKDTLSKNHHHPSLNVITALYNPQEIDITITGKKEIMGLTIPTCSMMNRVEAKCIETAITYLKNTISSPPP